MPYTVTYAGILQTVERTFTTRKRAEQWRAQVGRLDAAIAHVQTCAGCGRVLTDLTTKRVPAGRRYSQRHGFHNATAKSCTWCGTWVRWDEPIPRTVEELEKYATAHGSHFFDASTMRFFGSRILDGVTVDNGRAYFVTSEKQPTDYVAGYVYPRRYSARYMTAGCSIFEVGKFQEYDTARQARAAIRQAIEER